MDYQIQTETKQVGDLTWIRSFGSAKGLPATMATSDLVEATHYPEGFVKSGTLVALFTGGPNDGLWTPWVEDGANGEDTIGGVVYTGFQVRHDATGSPVSTRTDGSIFVPGQGLIVITSKLPELLLTDGTTANAPTDANLTAAGFIPLNLGV